jgi:hypothetical protein
MGEMHRIRQVCSLLRLTPAVVGPFASAHSASTSAAARSSLERHNASRSLKRPEARKAAAKLSSHTSTRSAERPTRCRARNRRLRRAAAERAAGEVNAAAEQRDRPATDGLPESRASPR